MSDKKKELLKTSITAREDEIFYYQINIDNYTLALKNIAAMDETDKADLSDFVSQLEGLLQSELLEQKKSKIMLEVLKMQMGG